MSVEWALIRGSGMMAFALLTASVVWGLLLSTKLVGKWVRAKPLTWFHESLGIGALLATFVHVFVISIHGFLDFTWSEILIPGWSDWRPLPIALGTLALYGLTVIVASFYVRKWIGQKTWRAIHFGAFGVFVASLLHGIQSGTDTAEPIVLGFYGGATIVVFALVAHRLTPSVERSPSHTVDQSSPNPVSTAPRSDSSETRS